jgi:hypothetical protein
MSESTVKNVLKEPEKAIPCPPGISYGKPVPTGLDGGYSWAYNFSIKNIKIVNDVKIGKINNDSIIQLFKEIVKEII